MSKYKHKEISVYKKGTQVHVDEIEYPQGQLGKCFENVDKDGEIDDFSDTCNVLRNCRVTIEWDD